RAARAASGARRVVRGSGALRGFIVPRARAVRERGDLRLRTLRAARRCVARRRAHRRRAPLGGALMLALGLVAIGTLAANGARQLRFTALAFFGVALAAQLLGGPSIALSQIGPTATAALVAAAVLYVAARDRRYGEDPGWRLWLATVVAAIT